MKNVLGQTTADGLGDITGNVDEIDPTGATAPNLLKLLTAAISSLTAGGRGVFTPTGTAPPGFPASSALYILSPNDFRLVSSSSADTHPQLMFFDH